VKLTNNYQNDGRNFGDILSPIRTLVFSSALAASSSKASAMPAIFVQKAHYF
jgi:hypothetical protein